jgi:hypothetical protein
MDFQQVRNCAPFKKYLADMPYQELYTKDDALLRTILENTLRFLADRFAHNGKTHQVVKKSIQLPTGVFFDSESR